MGPCRPSTRARRMADLGPLTPISAIELHLATTDYREFLDRSAPTGQSVVGVFLSVSSAHDRNSTYTLSRVRRGSLRWQLGAAALWTLDMRRDG